MNNRTPYPEINCRNMKKIIFLLLITFSVKSYAQVQLVSSGSGSAYSLTFPGVFSYSNGISFSFKAHAANSGAVTINVNSLGAKDIRKEASTALAANDIKTNQVVTLVYDGTNFQVTSDLPATVGGGGSGWNLTGNAGTNPGSNYIGTSDGQYLSIRAGGSEGLQLQPGGQLWQTLSGDQYSTNTAMGREALNSYSSQYGNSAFGAEALKNNEGENNTGVGNWALINHAAGNGNTAMGSEALKTDVSGSNNTALGYQADVASGNLTNATAIGARAIVSQSNSMVLGDISNTKVGIGTSTPAQRLHVNGQVRIDTVTSAAAADSIVTISSTGIIRKRTAASLASGGGGNTLTGDVTGNISTNTVEKIRGVNVLATAPITNQVLQYNGTNWAPATLGVGGGNPAWELGGNVGTDSTTNFIGTTDAQPLMFRVNNAEYMKLRTDGVLELQSTWGNTAIGVNSLIASGNANGNTALGFNALKDATSFSGDDGSYNTAIGASALSYNVSGINNTAVGYTSMSFATGGNGNTAVGVASLQRNVGGKYNTALGYLAMNAFNEPNADSAEYNTAVGSGSMAFMATGSYNTAVGSNAMSQNSSNSNSAFGHYALSSYNSGDKNNAFGANALLSNTAGYQNIAIGNDAQRNNREGSDNVAVGVSALFSNFSGVGNMAVGNNALSLNEGGFNNVAVGTWSLNANTDGSNNTAIGTYANTGSSNLFNATAIGYDALVTASDKVRLGSAFVTVIEGQVAYSFPSDGRFKTNISNADVKGLDFITKLRPVNYNFDTKKYEEFLTKNMPDSIRRKILASDFTKSTALRQTGFIAQEIEKAAKEAGYDFSGGLHIPENENDNYSVAYSQFVVPLVKSVQELNAKVEALEKENNALKGNSTPIAQPRTQIKTTEGFRGDENPIITAQQKEIDTLKTQNSTTKTKLDEMQKQLEEFKKLLEKK